MVKSSRSPIVWVSQPNHNEAKRDGSGVAYRPACELTDTTRVDAMIAPNVAAEAIKFALSLNDDSGIEFLRAWLHGDYDTIKAEWPEAPDSLKANP